LAAKALLAVPPIKPTLQEDEGAAPAPCAKERGDDLDEVDGVTWCGTAF